MSRLSPKNREEAFSYQLQDDAKMLGVAAISGEKEFEQVLQRIEAVIRAYRNKRLRSQSEKTKRKMREWLKMMEKKSPELAREIKRK